MDIKKKKCKKCEQYKRADMFRLSGKYYRGSCKLCEKESSILYNKSEKGKATP